MSDRPIETFGIAGVDYQIRCPKLRVWLEIVLQQENYDAGQALKPQVLDLIDKLSRDLPSAERNELVSQFAALQPVYSAAPNPLQFAQSILEFLCSCLIEDGAGDKLRAAYWSNDGVMDLPHLRQALRDMDEIFADWLDEQSDLTGVVRRTVPETPEPANRTARRATPRTKVPRPRPAATKRK